MVPGPAARRLLVVKGSRQCWAKRWASMQVPVMLRKEVNDQQERVCLYSDCQHAPFGASLLDISPWPVQRSSSEGVSLSSEGAGLWAGVGRGQPFLFSPLTYSRDSYGSKAPNGHNPQLFPLAYQ